MGKYSLFVLERKHWIIFFSALVGVGWFSLVLYTISASKQTQVIMPGSVATQSVKTELSGSVPSITHDWKGTRAKSVTGRESNTSPSSTMLPQPKMSSTSMHIRQTSDATAHTVGSGAIYETATGNRPSNQNKGISYNGLGFGGNMLAMSSAIVLSKPGAGYANDLAEVVSAPDKHGMKQTDGPPPGPMPDPVGDVTWGLMALLTIGYGIIRHRRKQQACK